MGAIAEGLECHSYLFLRHGHVDAGDKSEQREIRGYGYCFKCQSATAAAAEATGLGSLQWDSVPSIGRLQLLLSRHIPRPARE